MGSFSAKLHKNPTDGTHYPDRRGRGDVGIGGLFGVSCPRHCWHTTYIRGDHDCRDPRFPQPPEFTVLVTMRAYLQKLVSQNPVRSRSWSPSRPLSGLTPAVGSQFSPVGLRVQPRSRLMDPFSSEELNRFTQICKQTHITLMNYYRRLSETRWSGS